MKMQNIEDIVKEICEQNKQARVKTDGKFDSTKKYVFSYEKLLNDDRSLIVKSLWVEKLQEFDGRNVIIISEDEGLLEGTEWSIAEVWCKEVTQ